MIPQVIPEDQDEQLDTSGNKKTKPKTGGRKPLGGASHVVSVVNEVSKELLDQYRERGYSVRPMPSTYTSYFQRINAIILVEIENCKCAVKGIGLDGNQEELVLSASAQQRFLPKTKVGELLLAEIAYQKYGLHVPHNRLSKSLGLDGIEISRQDMSNYGLGIFERIGKAQECFKSEVLRQPALYMDETTTKKQGSEKTNNYMWAV